MEQNNLQSIDHAKRKNSKQKTYIINILRCRYDSKAWATIARIGEQNYIKLKSFCVAKEAM